MAHAGMAVADSAAGGATTGFGHFLVPPEPDAIAADPTVIERKLDALFELLSPAATMDLNPCMPTGYTFLLQFVGHDMIKSSEPMWRAGRAGGSSNNQRHRPLRLDTLYGGGPAAWPDGFEPASAGAVPEQLRLGATSPSAGLAHLRDTCPFRDVERGDAALTKPRLADPRSDEGLVLSQLVVLFSLLHNLLVKRLAANPVVPAAARFDLARVAMLHMYYAAIRQDLMPRLLNATVLEQIAGRGAVGPGWLWDGAGMPLEFSHGVFRCGHSMVRPSYAFNTQMTLDLHDVVNGPSWLAGARGRLPQGWVAQWSRFFRFDDCPAPEFSLKFAAARRLHLDARQLLEATVGAPPSMSQRDWLGASHARMLSIDALLSAPALKAAWPGLPWLPVSEVKTWLECVVAKAPGNPAAKRDIGNLGALAAELPLPLYVLLEAEKRGDGIRLGPLGSIIAGEVVFRRLAEAQTELASELPLAIQAFGTDWSAISGVNCMPKLVRLTADWGGLAACAPISFI